MNQFINNNTFLYNSDHSFTFTPTQLREVSTEILQKPSKNRNQNDIKILQLATQNIKFFQEILQEESIAVLHRCLQRIQLEIYPESTIVFEKGDKGKDFYIILSGSVGIYIYSNNIELHQQNKLPIRQAIKEQVNQLIESGIRPKKEHPLELRKILLYEKIKKLFKVNELHDGDSFGERALINEAARLATVVCETECFFGVLNKQDYREILQQAQSEKILQQITELQSVQGFQGMSRKLLTILLYAFQSQEHRYRDIIYKQGSINKNEIYLILSGEYIITQDQKITMHNPLRINHQGVKQIAILQKGSIFGDKESFQKLEFRTQTITCNSQYGKVLCIQLDCLQQRLQANNELHLINELKQLCEIKEQTREKRISCKIQSPRRSKSFMVSTSPNQKIDYIVKSKKEIFKQLNKNLKSRIQFIFDIALPRAKTPSNYSQESPSQPIRKRSAIDRIYLNTRNNSRIQKRQSLPLQMQTQYQNPEQKRFSFI
ncbi:unnamed protein product (macronuclear) [Paramecium tetraurelia]|uniref:Cyclic nucleotide-binding domain-containing protein n=1 Tax=Paramecium tetraurelia TaxID=5888 RepID=A0EEY6_PARTE|nr:uncharacterized protein GSPATT00026200001 [Paramecium tetraurelia]CAK93877.1 unnamed protein product [Paramecium tetraurelia]|eukprot:XP_001461250.1 hypothetical protein (macronuclear) [Paramecium tetraurelia strain d4-2]